jgi:phenylacetate-CoA ligase
MKYYLNKKVMKHLIILFYAWLVKIHQKILLMFDSTTKFIYMPGFNSLRHFNAKVRAYSEFIRAKRKVPAYAQFLRSKGFDRPSFTGMAPNIHEIPFTDKENYVKQYSMNERCMNGKVPVCGVIIDESSGSSGTATNWVRGAKERERNAKVIRFGMKALLGHGPMFIINAFALGPWATGVNITMSCVKFSKLKSLGPDRIKIINTIKHFGREHHYIIMGYPPFLKLLVDESDINWKKYNVTFIFGGECMTEGMREYLMERGIRRIYSSLGASDLELNLASENDFTISLRKLLSSSEQLRHKLSKHTGALPMIFQFNPSDFLIETSETGELIITVCRPDYIAPKIRYNLHDRGHVLQMNELKAALKELGIDESKLEKPSTDLPILLHYGRADMTVSFFGSNIAPNDVQEALFNTHSLSHSINSFCLCTHEDKQGNKQLIISLEMQKSKKYEIHHLERVQLEFFDQLAVVNQDFREARKMLRSSDQTILRFYEFGTGPFVDNDIRIKAKYINQAS